MVRQISHLCDKIGTVPCKHVAHFPLFRRIQLTPSFFCIHFRKLGLDLVPRTGTVVVDGEKVGIVSLHQVHVNSAENAKASSVSTCLIDYQVSR